MQVLPVAAESSEWATADISSDALCKASTAGMLGMTLNSERVC